MEHTLKVEEAAEEWDVQCILAAEFRKRRAGPAERPVWYYKVHWWGFTEEDDTWEPEENLAPSADLVRRFWEEGVGSMEKKLKKAPGKIKASREWIDKEMESFAQEVRREETESASGHAVGQPAGSVSPIQARKIRITPGSMPNINRLKQLEGASDIARSAADEKRRKTPPSEGSTSSARPSRTKKTKVKKRKLIVESDDEIEEISGPTSDVKGKGKTNKKARTHKSVSTALPVDVPAKPSLVSLQTGILPATTAGRLGEAPPPNDTTPQASVKLMPPPLFAPDDEASEGRSPSPLFTQASSPPPREPVAVQSPTSHLAERLKSLFSPKENTTTQLPSPSAANVAASNPIALFASPRTSEAALTPTSNNSPLAPAITLNPIEKSHLSTSFTAPTELPRQSPPTGSSTAEAPAQPSRTASAPTKGVSKHRGNRIQILDDQNVSAQGNATKAKLFPKADSLTAKRPDIAKRKLTGMHFKKLSPNTIATATTGSNADKPTLNASGMPPLPLEGFGGDSPSFGSDSAASPAASDLQKTGSPWVASGIVGSPVHQSNVKSFTGEDGHAMEGVEAQYNPGEPTQSGPPASISSSNVEDVDSFLENVVREDPITFGELHWSGELSLSPNNLCTLQIGINNVIPDFAQMKALLSIRHLLFGIKCILVERLLLCNDFLRLVRPAFGAPVQFAQVTAVASADRTKLKSFCHYLEDTNKVAVVHLALDVDLGNPKPRFYSIVLFSSKNDSVSSALKVPQNWTERNSEDFVLVLLKQNTKAPFKEAIEHPPIPTNSPLHSANWNKSATSLSNRVDRYALTILGITSSMMSAFRGVTYCMFPDEAQARLDRWGYALFQFLTRVVKAKRVSVEDSTAKYIFVHATGLSQLEKLHKFHERRMFPQVSFYTYGQDLCSQLQMPVTLRPIFQVGGILTFTARAVVEDPRRVENLIAQVNKDQFWDVYILPSAVALVDELAACEAGQPNEYGRTVHCSVGSLSAVLTSPEDGGPRITISFRPPVSTFSNEPNGPWQWYTHQLEFAQLKDPVEILKRCKAILKEDHSPSIVRATKGRDAVEFRAAKARSTMPATFGIGANGNLEKTHDNSGGWGDSISVDPTAPQLPSTMKPSGLELWNEHATKEERQALEDRVNMEVIRDVAAMQLQPALSNYRRFVVVTENTFEPTMNFPVEVLGSNKFSLTERS